MWGEGWVAMRVGGERPRNVIHRSFAELPVPNPWQARPCFFGADSGALGPSTKLRTAGLSGS